MKTERNHFSLNCVYRVNSLDKCPWALAVISFIQSCVSQSGGPRPILAYEQMSHTNRDTITWYQWTCSPVEFSKLFFGAFKNFPSLLSPLSQFVCIKFRTSIYLQQSMMLLRENMNYVVSVMLSTDVEKGLAIDLILFYPRFTERSLELCMWVLTVAAQSFCRQTRCFQLSHGALRRAAKQWLLEMCQLQCENKFSQQTWQSVLKKLSKLLLQHNSFMFSSWCSVCFSWHCYA